LIRLRQAYARSSSAGRNKGQPQPRTPKAFGGTFSGVKWTQIFADKKLFVFDGDFCDLL